MQAITFNYNTSSISDAITQYNDAVTQSKLEEFSQEKKVFDIFVYNWMTTAFITIAAITAIIFVLSFMTHVVSRAAKSSHEQSINNAGNVAFIGALGFILTVVVFGAFTITSLIIDSTGTRVDHPDYEAALAETVTENREDINDAVHLAAVSQDIDLDHACQNGKVFTTKATGGYMKTTNPTQLVQCGGTKFGALVYANLDDGQFQSISTSTGTMTFTVIAATGDEAEHNAAEYSSVQFPGVDTTIYKPNRRYADFAWRVDAPNADDAVQLPEPPYDDERVMTLEEAKKNAL